MLISTPLGTVEIYAEGGEPDTIPPAFADGYPKAYTQPSSMAGSRQISFSIKTLEKAYYYYVVLKHGATPPTKDQVVAGKDGDNNLALKSSNSGSSKYDDIGMGVILPLHNTVYDVYVVIKDDAGNMTEPAHIEAVSAAASEYFVTGYPQIGAVQPDGSRQVEIKLNLENIESDKKGKVYWVLLPDGAVKPSIEQIAAGTDGNDSPAISSGSPEFTPGIEGRFLVTGEAGTTDYDLYMVVGNTGYAYPLGKCTDIIDLDIITPADIEGEKVCAIGGVQYGTLNEAFENANTGETIDLLKSFTSIKGITIDSKDLTLNLNGNILNIETTANEGLKTTNASLTLTGDGKLNVSGKLYGVWAGANSNITVSNANASDTGKLGIGVYAIAGSEVIVRENAFGIAHGVRAENIYTKVTVNGNVSSNEQIEGAVYSAGQAEVIVKGNVTNTMGCGVYSYYGSITVEKDVLGNRVGAMAQGDEANIYIKGNLSSYNNGAVIEFGNSSIITVDGEIITSGNYVSINSKYLTKTEGTIDSEKSGYLKYSVSGANGKVWVKNTIASIEVYTALDLEDALTNVVDGGTIKLMNTINYDKPIVVEDKNIVLDLEKGSLIINTNMGTALTVTNGSITNIGSGYIDVKGTSAGVRADKGTVTVRYAEATGGTGAYADNGSAITVLGDSKGYAMGAYAERDSSITVNDDAMSSGAGSRAVEASAGGYIQVKNAVASGANSYGAKATNATIYITNDVVGVEGGAWALNSGEITVGRNVTADGGGSYGAKSETGGTITIDGLITAENYAKVGVITKTFDDKIIPSTKVGYLTYTDDISTVWVKDGTPTVTYVLTVQNGLGSGNYLEGAKVNISADVAPEGNVFSHWTSDNGGGFADENSANTIFTMPANSVTVKANYKAVDIPEIKYIISSSAGAGGTISPNGSIDVEENGSRTFVIIPNGNYEVSSVLVDGVEQGKITSYTFNNVTTNHAISALFSVTTSSGIKPSKGSSKSSASTIVTILSNEEPNHPLVAATTLNAKLDNEGNGMVEVPDSIVKDVINKATLEAEKQNKIEDGIGVCFVIKYPKNTKALNLIFTQQSMKLLTDSKVQQFEIECDLLNLKFNLEALQEILKQSKDDVTISISPNTELTKEKIEFIAVRSAYNIAISYMNNGKKLNINDLNNGKITLSIPYTLNKDEAANYMYGIMLDEEGSIIRLSGSFYDVNNHKIIIDNDFISTYGVGYTSPSARFTDISTHWAKDSIDYVVGRDLFKGTTDNTFSPDLTISRGMLVTVLGRLTDAKVSTYKIGSFSDVSNDMYYMPYIEWAYKNNIVKGVDETNFEPDRGMTREEVALVLQNYAKATNYNLPISHDLIIFDDSDYISDFAKDAVKIIQQAGIIMGDQNNKLNPQNAVSRGEVAAILQRYIKLNTEK